MIDLRLTMESGQPPEFLWIKNKNKYTRLLNGREVTLWQEGEEIKSKRLSHNYLKEFLRLDDNLREIYEVIGSDMKMKKAIKEFEGLRITRNDPWETTASFICSINSNIPRIKKNVQCLLGKDGNIPLELYSQDLSYVKLGFRERYIRETSRLITGGFFEGIEKLGYYEAREKLIKLPGVGPKVADCILLFSLGKLEAFPVDVWIARAMKRYFKIEGDKKVRAFARKEWHPYEGYAQQYLYMKVRRDFGKVR